MSRAGSVANQLRDIKPLVQISDYSIYVYWALVVVGVILVLLAIFILYYFLIKNKKANKEKEYLEALNHIDWSSPKKAAYKATYYGRLLAKDDRRKELYTQLLHHLDKYKYKKDVQKADSDTLRAFDLYKRICNESV